MEVENLCSSSELIAGLGIRANNHGVRVEQLRDPNCGRAGGLKVHWQTEPIKRIQPVAAAYGEKASGTKPAVEDICGAFANPVEVGLPGAIFKGQDEKQPSASLCRCFGLGRGLLGLCDSEREIEEDRKKDRDEPSGSEHQPHEMDYSCRTRALLTVGPAEPPAVD